MKVFQILDGVCYYDASALHTSAAEADGLYPADIVLVDAPDYVLEGWGYDAAQEGEARFIETEEPEPVDDPHEIIDILTGEEI